ncbi:glycoside hydrolase family 28 protein [Spirosoma validum]|uniref:Glycoside hydrolase family 28 protein n=1 Tax=Spirosoma validum TaxID=2771355 RepID=A0A927B2T5_9BACT|nr:glycoside hydrolase family 28 protein [Spirosoma validum]MBD2754365.1 glycoside hydrolase family 28 protein [Spirosoma validum]
MSHVKHFLFCLLLATSVFAQQPSGVWDVLAYGAKGDGKTMDTKAIQTAIDQCHAAGGGRVYLHNGTFLSGTIYLKSNVTLSVEAGATLLGSPKAADYPDQTSEYPTYDEHPLTSKALVYAENCRNISIEGRGTIDGRGDMLDNRGPKDPYMRPSFKYRPRILHIRGCENVLIKGVTLQNSASWVQTYQGCKNMVIDGITVDSRENKDVENPNREHAVKHRNTDGMDLVDCEVVRVSNCFITSGDDGICIKSFSPDKVCRNINITNCHVSSGASGIKIGTETAGRFEDIVIQNCTVFDTWGDGLAIMTVDGARIKRVTISDISLRNIKRAGIFVRLNTRNKKYGTNTTTNKPALLDILIANLQGSRLAALGCSITGLTDYPVENVILRNLNFEFEGGITDVKPTSVPEKADVYPVGTMFGATLPAYGFYVRHVRNITFDQVQLRFVKEDQRPAMVFDDTEDLEIRGFKAQSVVQTPELIRLINTRKTIIADSRPTATVAAFLSVYGDKSSAITLINNQLGQSKQTYFFETPSLKASVKESGTIQ